MAARSKNKFLAMSTRVKARPLMNRIHRKDSFCVSICRPIKSSSTMEMAERITKATVKTFKATVRLSVERTVIYRLKMRAKQGSTPTLLRTMKRKSNSTVQEEWGMSAMLIIS